MNLQEILKKHYKLEECSTDQERIEIIEDKIGEINEIRNQLESLKQVFENKIQKSYVLKWKKYLQNNYGNYYEEYVKLDLDNDDIFVGVVLTLCNKKVVIYIEKDNGNLCCTIKYMNKYKISSLKKQLQDLLPEDSDEYLWKYFDIDDYDGVFKCFKNVIKKCLDN